MNHAATQDFQPSAALANPAIRATTVVPSTKDAADIQLGTRLDEGKLARAKSAP
jgi:hypothetical protein